MKEMAVDYYYIGSCDCHNSEYVCDYYKLREYVSGFNGSAGSLIITQQDAYLWTDGRYFIQAEEQLKGSGFELMKIGEEGVPKISEYLKKHMQEGEVLGYDASCVPAKTEKDMLKPLQHMLKEGKIAVRKDVTIASLLWDREGTRKKLEFHEIVPFPFEYAGESVEKKCERLTKYMKENKKDGYIISSLDEIAWLVNLRGDDIPCNPVFFSYFIWYRGQSYLYCAMDQLSQESQQQLAKSKIELRQYDTFYNDLMTLSGELIADERLINAKIADVLRKKSKKEIFVNSPVTLWKAIKNKNEIAGEKACHVEDGIAMVNFMYWLKKICHFNAEGILTDENEMPVTEILAAKRLEQERSFRMHYQGPSFDPIVAVKEHGAIVHYSADEASNARFVKDTFVLMDTGGQYLNGTTDITRTIVLGEVKEEQKRLYTAVLKGNLRIQNAVFKKGSRGENLDILAREALWRMGYDYNHGTGHGVGCCLNVHEGPVSIRFRITETELASAKLEPGMITSNEPGVYIENEYGIRLENMLVCIPYTQTGNGEFYTFDVLTLVPWELDAILVEELNPEERELLNNYHEKVYNTLKPYLEPEVASWLREAAQAI